MSFTAKTIDLQLSGTFSLFAFLDRNGTGITSKSNTHSSTGATTSRNETSGDGGGTVSSMSISDGTTSSWCTSRGSRRTKSNTSSSSHQLSSSSRSKLRYTTFIFGLKNWGYLSMITAHSPHAKETIDLCPFFFLRSDSFNTVTKRKPEKRVVNSETNNSGKNYLFAIACVLNFNKKVKNKAKKEPASETDV